MSDQPDRPPEWFKRHEEAWRQVVETLSDPHATGLIPVLSGKVIYRLQSGTGITYNGQVFSIGGIGAHPKDVEEVSEIWNARYPFDLQIKAVLEKFTAVLRASPTPSNLARTSSGKWSAACGLGFNKPEGPDTPEWLSEQTLVFRDLIATLDRIAQITVASFQSSNASSAAATLTAVGGVELVGITTYDGKEPRYAARYGPGSHPDDLRKIAERNKILTMNSVVTVYTAYLDALSRQDVPFYIIATSPGPAALKRWGVWYGVEVEAFSELIKDIRETASDAIKQPLIQSLERPYGIECQGAGRLPIGGPGAHPRDVKKILEVHGWGRESLAPAQTERWAETARSYLSVLRQYWVMIPDDIRLSGGGAHKAKLAPLTGPI